MMLVEKCRQFLEPIRNPAIAFSVFAIVGFGGPLLRNVMTPPQSTIFDLLSFCLLFVVAFFGVAYLKNPDSIKDNARMKEIVYKKVLPYSILALVLSLEDAYRDVGALLGLNLAGPTDIGIFLHAFVFAVLIFFLDPSTN